MKYIDISFLEEQSSLKENLEGIRNLFALGILGDLEIAKNEIANLDNNFLKLALKSLGLSSIDFFLKEGKSFFSNFPIITTYEGLAGLLSGLFLSNEISIISTPGYVEIEATNENDALIANYIDENEKDYIDKTPKDYVGFKADEDTSLESFFKYFLNQFLPAGVILKSIKINSKAKQKQVIKRQKKTKSKEKL